MNRQLANRIAKLRGASLVVANSPSDIVPDAEFAPIIMAELAAAHSLAKARIDTAIELAHFLLAASEYAAVADGPSVCCDTGTDALIHAAFAAAERIVMSAKCASDTGTQAAARI